MMLKFSVSNATGRFNSRGITQLGHIKNIATIISDVSQKKSLLLMRKSIEKIDHRSLNLFNFINKYFSFQHM